MSTKAEMIQLYQALNKLGNLSGVKFAYAVSKNINLIEPEIKSLEKSLEASDEFKKFEEKRMALVEKFAKKNEKGEKIVKDNQYEIDNQKEFDEEFENLKVENKEVYDARQKQIEEYNDLLQSESTVELHKINLSDVPSNITVAQMASISSLVEESIPTPYNK